MPNQDQSRIRSVLLVEDDSAVAVTLTRVLEGEGYAVDHVVSGEEALTRIEAQRFSMMILDVGLPGMDGFEVLDRVRKREGSPPLPVIMLTAEDSEEAIVQGLRSGAEDYVVKPFSTPELLARIEAVLRRSQGRSISREVRGNLSMDLVGRWVEQDGRSVRLTSKELSILWNLAQEPGKVMGRKELLDQVWGIDFDPGTTIFDVHLSRLRKKLASIGSRAIRTVRGKGYRFDSGETG